jgi:hypothetical protein
MKQSEEVLDRLPKGCVLEGELVVLRDDRIERMLSAGTSLDRACAFFADFARHRPAARRIIRQAALT